jgi:hypothetical protein
MAGRNRLVVGALVAMTTAALTGCSDPYAGRQAISGTVKLEGQPLKQGFIGFEPLDKNLGTQTGSTITDGQFTVPRDAGLKPGQYLVKISSGDGKTPTKEEDAGGPSSTNIVSVDMIPEDWNVKSQQKVEVKSDGKNKFDFEIPKANPRAKRR